MGLFEMDTVVSAIDSHQVASLLLGAGILVIFALKLAEWWESRSAALFMRSLAGKHLVITGASSGIGYAIAKRGIQEGAYVTLVARNRDKLKKGKGLSSPADQMQPRFHTSEGFAQSYGFHIEIQSDQLVVDRNYNVWYINYPADAGDAVAISAAIGEAHQWRPIDVLVCNAGVAVSGHFDEIAIKDLDETVRINIMGSVYPVHAALPLMKQRGLSNPSSIVFISSIAGLFSCYGGNVYAATKYAQRGIAEVLRWELMPYNIRVNVVCPGFVDTPMLTTSVELPTKTAAIGRDINNFDRSKLDQPDDVAACTLEGVKKGTYLITTNPLGALAAVLSRGPIPEDSIISNLKELALAIPARLLGHRMKTDMTEKIFRHVNPAGTKKTM